MKICSLVILLVFIGIGSAYGKEYQSSFGFVADIPNHWLVITRQELKEKPEFMNFDRVEFRKFDKKMLKDMTDKVKAGNVEILFNQRTSDANFSESINIMQQNNKTTVNEANIYKWCESFPTDVSSAFGRKIMLYQCKLVNINNSKALLLEFDGVIEGTRVIQYQIQKSDNIRIIITAGCRNSVLSIIRKEFDRFVFSIKM